MVRQQLAECVYMPVVLPEQDQAGVVQASGISAQGAWLLPLLCQLVIVLAQFVQNDCLALAQLFIGKGPALRVQVFESGSCFSHQCPGLFPLVQTFQNRSKSIGCAFLL